MPDRKQKTLSYRRTIWLTPSSETLESRLIAARRQRGTVARRTFNKDNGQVIKGVVCQLPQYGGVILHVTAETPGDNASILESPAENAESIAVGTAPPPSNAEFMDGDIFAYVRHDHVFVCSSSLRDTTLSWFLRKMFEAARLSAETTQFDLKKVADLDRLRVLNEEGVKEISLGTTLYEATIGYERRQHQLTGVLSAAGRHISALFGSDRRPTPDNLKISIVLKADGRMREGEVLGYRRIGRLAAELVDSDDDYTITTRSGRKITPESIVVKKIVELPVHGKSVTRSSAVQALAAFYNELSTSGILDQ
jgi:hypothetical protein